MTFLVLWIAGLIMVFLEFYLPGAILGTIGGILLVLSIIEFAGQYPPAFTFLYTAAVIASVFFLIKYALEKIKKSKSKDSFYSEDAQTGYYASVYDKGALGKQGVVLTDLRPGGYIEIEGKQHPAISESGYIVQGERVKVIRGEGDSLIVVRI